MKTKLRTTAILAMGLLFTVTSVGAGPVGTAFTYQWQLKEEGVPAPHHVLAEKAGDASGDKEPETQLELDVTVRPPSVGAEASLLSHAHEVVVRDADRPNSLAVAQGELYWAFLKTGPDCGIGEPDDGSKLSTAKAGGSPVTNLLGPDCGFAPFLARTDGAHVYFAEGVTNTINRILVDADVDRPADEHGRCGAGDGQRRHPRPGSG